MCSLYLELELNSVAQLVIGFFVGDHVLEARCELSLDRDLEASFELLLELWFR